MKKMNEVMNLDLPAVDDDDLDEYTDSKYFRMLDALLFLSSKINDLSV